MRSSRIAPLSERTRECIALLFGSEDGERVAQLLAAQCGNNLPGLEHLDATQLERFRFAVLKLSGGELAGVERALKLALVDWRDLLMAAGFAEDLHAHLAWTPNRDRS